METYEVGQRRVTRTLEGVTVKLRRWDFDMEEMELTVEELRDLLAIAEGRYQPPKPE